MPNNTFTTASTSLLTDSLKEEFSTLLARAQDALQAGLYTGAQILLEQLLQRYRDERIQQESIYSVNAIVALCQIEFYLNKKTSVLERINTLMGTSVYAANKYEMIAVHTLILRSAKLAGDILYEQKKLQEAKKYYHYAYERRKQIPNFLFENEAFQLFSSYSLVLAELLEHNKAIEVQQELLNILHELEHISPEEMLSLKDSFISTIRFFVVGDTKFTATDHILSVHFTLAQFYSAIGDYESSLKELNLVKQHSSFKKLGNISKQVFFMYNNLYGYVSYRLGHEDAALQTYETMYTKLNAKAQFSQDQYVGYLSDLASLYAHKNDIERVKKIYTEFLSFKKSTATEVERASHIFGLVDYYQNQKDYIRIRNFYELALIYYPTNSEPSSNIPVIADIRYSIGCIENQLGNYDAAIKHLQRALGTYRLQTEQSLSSTTKTIQALQELALAYKKVNRYQDAETKLKNAFEIGVKAFDRELKSDQEFDEAFVNIVTERAELYIEQQRWNDAFELLEQTKSLPIKSNYTQFWKIDLSLANFHAAKGEYQIAQQKYESLLQLFKSSYTVLPRIIKSNPEIIKAIPEILEKIAVIYEQKKDFEGAVMFRQYQDNITAYLASSSFEDFKGKTSFKKNGQGLFPDINNRAAYVPDSRVNLTARLDMNGMIAR